MEPINSSLMTCPNHVPEDIAQIKSYNGTEATPQELASLYIGLTEAYDALASGSLWRDPKKISLQISPRNCSVSFVITDQSLSEHNFTIIKPTIQPNYLHVVMGRTVDYTIGRRYRTDMMSLSPTGYGVARNVTEVCPRKIGKRQLSNAVKVAGHILTTQEISVLDGLYGVVFDPENYLGSPIQPEAGTKKATQASKVGRSILGAFKNLRK